MAPCRSRLDDPRLSGSRSSDALPTEAGGEAGLDYDLRPTLELVGLMNLGDETVPGAVAAVAEPIAAAIDAIASRLGAGGRLVYVGAGTSGRIAALDAVECETTFSTPSGRVTALVAGGMGAEPVEQAVAEDDREAGAAAVRGLEVGPQDAVVGVSASGRTPFVLGALEAAGAAGALCTAIVSVRESELAALSDHEIAVVVGPEFLAGSTRLKAGTAQKLVLNMVSTISMIRLGKTFGNLMVDVDAANEKLGARVHRIVGTATGASDEAVEDALVAANGNAKVAIVSLLAGVEADEARARLDDADQSVRLALGR